MKAHPFLRNNWLLAVTGEGGMIFFHIVATGELNDVQREKKRL